MLCRYSIQTRKGEQNIVKPKTPIAVVDPSIAGIFTEVFSLFPSNGEGGGGGGVAGMPIRAREREGRAL